MWALCRSRHVMSPTFLFCCPFGHIEPIEVEGHEEAASRDSENKRPRHCQCSIFLIFVVHTFSPNHSGCEQFSCKCYRRHLLWFDTHR
jgi:hypothetical protein